MAGFRIFYILSLVLLLVLLGFTASWPMASGGKYSEVQREHLLETNEEWIIQFDILNSEGRGVGYVIQVLVNGQPYTDSVVIRDGGKYTYIHHINKALVQGGAAIFRIYKEGEQMAMEEATYYLKEAGR